jgi:hypothetical protein
MVLATKYRNSLKKNPSDTYTKKSPHPKVSDHLNRALFIASPLPTKIGVTILASTKRITTKKFSLIAYTLHIPAISVLLLISNALQ